MAHSRGTAETCHILIFNLIIKKHKMHDSKDKSIFKFAPYNLFLAAILDFGEGYKSCLYSFNVNKSRFKLKYKTYWY